MGGKTTTPFLQSIEASNVYEVMGRFYVI